MTLPGHGSHYPHFSAAVQTPMINATKPDRRTRVHLRWTALKYHNDLGTMTHGLSNDKTGATLCRDQKSLFTGGQTSAGLLPGIVHEHPGYGRSA